MLLYDDNAFNSAEQDLKLRIIQNAISICKSIKLNDFNHQFFYVGVTNNIVNRMQQHDKEFRSVLVYDFDYQDKDFVNALEAYLVNKYNFKNDVGAESDSGTIFYVLRRY